MYPPDKKKNHTNVVVIYLFSMLICITFKAKQRKNKATTNTTPIGKDINIIPYDITLINSLTSRMEFNCESLCNEKYSIKIDKLNHITLTAEI